MQSDQLADISPKEATRQGEKRTGEKKTGGKTSHSHLPWDDEPIKSSYLVPLYLLEYIFLHTTENTCDVMLHPIDYRC